jgi:hypothetical protein
MAVNTEEIKYIFIPRQQKAGENLRAIISCENMAKFKYFGRTVTFKIACTINLRADYNQGISLRVFSPFIGYLRI